MFLQVVSICFNNTWNTQVAPFKTVLLEMKIIPFRASFCPNHTFFYCFYRALGTRKQFRSKSFCFEMEVMPGGAVIGRFFKYIFRWFPTNNIGLAWHLLPIGSPFLRLEAATVRVGSVRAVRTLKLGCTPMQLLGGTDVITRIRFEVIWSHKTSPKDPKRWYDTT